MSSISGNGATESVFLQMSGPGATPMQYSVGATPGSWNTITTWPVTINNSNPTPGSSSILNVKATQPLRISSSTGGTSGYFIAGTTYITFDGSGNTITIDTITSYPGFIRNGTTAGGVAGYGKANVIVKNFTTTISGASTLSTQAGWLCQFYFGNGVTGTLVTNCTNNGVINVVSGGGIVGSRFGTNTLSAGAATISYCTNNGNLSTFDAGGIAGGSIGSAVQNAVTISYCTNNANLGPACGGIVGSYAGESGGYVTITYCTNNGDASNDSGGIAGQYLKNGIISYCTNTGNISGVRSGGIVGSGVGYFTTSNALSITNCFNTGTISGQFAGGITGQNFGYGYNGIITISNCYSTGAIGTGTTGNNGGILGSNPGYNNNANTATINITNCYSTGAVAASCGGIVGGKDSNTYNHAPTLNITNCYSSGVLTGTGAGMVAVAYPFSVTPVSSYTANGSWTDAAANANLTGTPTSLTSGNPGATWATIATNTPYILSAFNAALYSPSSASAEYGYATSAGLFTPGYTYQILQNSQSGATATTQVVAYKGASTNYNSYNINTFAMTNQRGAFLISATINSSTGVLSYTLGTPCFLEGTKILCLKNNVEQYQPIESLRKGDLVKTIYNGYVPIYMIGTTSLYNPGNDYRVVNRLYKCPKENYPSLFEDLYITGCHSILVPSMTDDQWENTKAVNGNVFVTDNHFRLIACADEKALPFNKEGFMNIYHIALEHSDKYMNYGIYANGLLVETCSKRYIKELSGMRILGEEDCTASQSMQFDNVFNKNTGLIETC